MSPMHRERLKQTGLRFSGRDEAGEVRALELPSCSFFIGTLFQPERVALRDEAHPLMFTFVRASLDRRDG